MKKLLLILIIISPILSFGQANKFYRKAIRTVDIEERINLLNQAIALEPNHLDAYFYRALAKNELGDYSGAIVDYSKIIITNPDADSYFNRGNSRFSLKNLEGAKFDYAKAYELDPNFIDALFSLACVKFDLEDYKGAIEDFNKVLKIAPDFSKVYLLRASCYKELKDYKKALADYTLAVIISPDANTYYNRGVFLMDINYYAKANQDLTKSLRLNSNNTFAHFYRGASHLLLGKYDKAIQDFSNALELDSMDFDAHFGLAFTYFKMKDYKNAKLHLQKAKGILNLDNTSNGSEQYENTYWHQSQYYFFVNNLNEISKL
ncbi:tetratricopeptide repeat protein [Seonamhaeicola maritimus]|uniref:Tetratricopeptide repeat protein n=1 Tax=Seonamhaeicola maritimus TaxID=2591822 RepID=A0A5C7GK80_9FLAO|nr:tetratricopeptide repeat protein [Seonamhaeicola maritimus]TXG38690.1 tetratricopeptide repeat protein [Seonamhaeicola maritimus]